jgi:putative colanic acid biosysnthesis UDP-glucose lipid carrier transferase
MWTGGGRIGRSQPWCSGMDAVRTVQLPTSSADAIGSRSGVQGVSALGQTSNGGSLARGPSVEASIPPGRVHGTADAARSEPVGGHAKRCFDIVVSALLILFLVPLLVIVAILVRASSPGAALFTQDRGGFGGRTFRIYKFRSMTHHASPDNSVRQATREDARVTGIGRYLRMTSIDELPQLFNVLRGDMSLVGPRPHALAHNLEWARRVDGYDARCAARPGITGLAQVRGARGLVSEDADIVRRVGFDIEYIRTWSMWGDFKIIFDTIRVVFSDPKAF